MKCGSVECGEGEVEMQKGELRLVETEGSSTIERMRARGDGDKRASLDEEIVTLRKALKRVERSMESGEEDTAKMGALVSRLCDTIARALVAQQKLSVQDEGFTWLRAQFDRMLRELGYGET